MSRKPPLAPEFEGRHNDDGGSSTNTCDLENSLPTQKLMADGVPRTRLRACCQSLEQHMKHWNLGYDSNTCCPFHASVRVCGIAFQKLQRRKCNPLWSPFIHWSCQTCTCTNHRHA